MTTPLNNHTGELRNVGTRLVVAYKQIPGNPMNALVIKLDTIVRDADRDALREMVQSPEAQLEKDFINFLHKKNLLNLYHEKKFFTVVPVDEVVMIPGNGQKIPLRDVINSINGLNGLAPLPTQEELNSISARDPMAAQKQNEIMQTETKANIAKNVLVQAKMMQDEVNKKISQALSLDPTLKPIADRILAGLPLQEPIKVEVSTAEVKDTKKTTKTSTKKRKTTKASATAQ